MYPVLGASLLSAAASLPLHLMPFLVVSLVAQARLPLEQAGWIASAYMVGQLLSAVALPVLGVARLRLAPAAAAASLVAVGPWLSYHGSAPALLAAWFAVGTACGTLQFLGATTAAAARRKTAAFALRLCVILSASGMAIALLGSRADFGDYGTLAWQMGLILALLGASGLALYRPPPAAAPRPHPLPGPQLWGLVALFLVFAGQPGFWAYAVQGAQHRGLEVGAVALAVAASKVMSALLLAAAVRRPSNARAGLLGPGLVVGAGILLMSGATSLAPFLVGVLLWEMAVNLLSVRFQAAAVQHAGAACGPWLTAAIFLGAAAGPLLHGLAIQAQVQSLFIAFACMSALVPFAWSLRRTNPQLPKGA
jgi:hypothetical protein